MHRAETPPASWRLGDLAQQAGGEVVGDPDIRIEGLRTLERAGPRDLSFLTRSGAGSGGAHSGYRELAGSCAAAALVVPRELAEQLAGQRPLVLAEDPALALARLIPLFHPPREPVPGIHPTAVVEEGCEIDPSAHLGAYTVIGEGCQIGAATTIHAHVVLGRGCRIAAKATLFPHVVLYDHTEIGERAIVHAGVVLGADGFGFVTHHGEHLKVPQVGRTVIEADVEIGALSAVDRALLEETRVGAGTKIDNLVQVGHNVEVGRGCFLCGQAGIAGSARLDDYVVMGGQSGVTGHISVGRGVQVAGKSAVFQPVADGRQVAGIPAIDLKRWRRQSALLKRLGDLLRRLRTHRGFAMPKGPQEILALQHVRLHCSIQEAADRP